MPKALYSDASKLLRELLIEARERAEITQSVLAKRLSKPQSFVAKYENGERRLDLIEFLEVAKAIGCDPLRIVRKLQKES